MTLTRQTGMPAPTSASQKPESRLSWSSVAVVLLLAGCPDASKSGSSLQMHGTRETGIRPAHPTPDPVGRQSTDGCVIPSAA